VRAPNPIFEKRSLGTRFTCNLNRRMRDTDRRALPKLRARARTLRALSTLVTERSAKMRRIVLRAVLSGSLASGLRMTPMTLTSVALRFHGWSHRLHRLREPAHT